METENEIVFQEHTVDDPPEPSLEVIDVPKKTRKRQPATEKQRDHLRKCREAKELKRQAKLQDMENEMKLKREEDMKQYKEQMVETICNQVLQKMEANKPKPIDLKKYYSSW